MSALSVATIRLILLRGRLSRRPSSTARFTKINLLFSLGRELFDYADSSLCLILSAVGSRGLFLSRSSLRTQCRLSRRQIKFGPETVVRQVAGGLLFRA